MTVSLYAYLGRGGVLAAALLAFAATARAEEAKVQLRNTTVETTTRVNGAVSTVVTGNLNKADTNTGTVVRGANVENSTLKSDVRVNGAVTTVVTGNANAATTNTGLLIANH